MSSAWTETPGSDYLDTVTLLQEEIARLEAELRGREEGASGVAAVGRDGPSEEIGARVRELTALLAERDETLGLLCDQVAALEEVAAARAAEWEQMDRWVRALEERIEREGAMSADPDEELRQAEVLREQLEGREQAWEAERAHLEREIASLRSRLAESSVKAGDQARAAIEAENHRLRDECRRLAAFEAVAADVEASRDRSVDLQVQLDQTRQALGQALDDLRRERFEHDAELAALRASLANAKAAAPAESSPDERIRALRLHLREVQEREDQEREQRQLASRLSRLWGRPASRK